MVTVTTTVLVEYWGQMPNGVPQRTGGGRRDWEAISNSFKFSYKGKQRNGVVVGRIHRDSRGL